MAVPLWGRRNGLNSRSCLAGIADCVAARTVRRPRVTHRTVGVGSPEWQALRNHLGSGRSTISGRAGRTNAPAGTSLKTTAFGPMDAWSPTVIGPTTTALGAR